MKKYGNIVKYYEIFNQPALIITDTAMVQDIALSNTYDYIKPNLDSVAFIGRGLALSEEYGSNIHSSSFYINKFN
ncbi:hypothetical protein C1646_812045 [Rhizophagus diaphanus]|nr:hypothetical protein C1646_812045 [Rhizophagus diaphanus] [Rhizophagus sp. MUCL 43196]